MRKLKRCLCCPCFVFSLMITMPNRLTSVLLLSLLLLILCTVWLQVDTVHFQDFAFDIKNAGNPQYVWEHGHWVENPKHNIVNYNVPRRTAKTTYCKIYNVSRGIDADFKCINMKTKPSAKVCLYQSLEDIYVSHDLAHTGLWEPHVLFDFQDVLQRDFSLGVVDIGANIGVYSLLAAEMGHQVISVEPYVENIYRIHKAANISRLNDMITVVQNGISNVRGNATIRKSGNNQGDTRIEMDVKQCIGACPPIVKMILLDDLLEVAKFSRAVIKIDSQGYEHRSFKHAEKLLDTIYVPYIYMEWILMRDMHVSSSHVSEDKTMVQDMIKMLLNRNYRPHKLDAHGAKVLDPNEWYAWPVDIVWRLKPNKKERSKLLSNHFKIWP